MKEDAISKSNGSGGIGLLSVLGCIFLTLKLCDVIAWSWWFVLMPFYIVPAIMLALVLFAGFCFGVAGILDHFFVGKKK
jgi:hypothetical protein